MQCRRRLAEFEPENPQALSSLSVAYNKLSEWMIAQGRFDEARPYEMQALEPMVRAAALAPDDAGIQYNLACAYARVGATDESLAALSRAIDLGYGKANWAAEDPDLRSLRGLPEFRALLARMSGG